MGLDLGAIEFYVGPKVLGGPDDLEVVVRDFIAGAEKRLLIAVQELDSRTIAEAILAAKAAKVRVQLILEGDYLVEDPPVADPWAETGDNEYNRAIHSAVLRAGVDVITDLNPKIFHQKFMVRDPELPTAAVLTGSTNFTLTDTGKNTPGASAVSGNNLNHVVVLHSERAADQYLAEFQRYRSGTFGELHERHEPRPAEFRLAKIRVKPLFAPMHAPEMELMKQMLKARSSIDFAMFTFAESSGIDDTHDPSRRIAPACARGTGSRPGRPGVGGDAAPEAAGVQLFQKKTGTGVRKIHHKLMVVDERLVIAGSFNYTAPGTTLNDENIIVLGDLEETDPDAEAAQRQLAAYALAEIERIITDLAEPV